MNRYPTIPSHWETTDHRKVDISRKVVHIGFYKQTNNAYYHRQQDNRQYHNYEEDISGSCIHNTYDEKISIILITINSQSFLRILV